MRPITWRQVNAAVARHELSLAEADGMLRHWDEERVDAESEECIALGVQPDYGPALLWDRYWRIRIEREVLPGLRMLGYAYVTRDPEPSECVPPQGVLYPKLLTALLTARGFIDCSVEFDAGRKMILIGPPPMPERRIPGFTVRQVEP